MDRALQEGILFLTDQGSDLDSAMVIFLTDGMPTAGQTDGDIILENTIKRNQKEIPIFSLAFGEGADWALVKKLSVQNRGVARRIYEDSDSALQVCVCCITGVCLLYYRCVFAILQVCVCYITIILFCPCLGLEKQEKG